MDVTGTWIVGPNGEPTKFPLTERFEEILRVMYEDKTKLSVVSLLEPLKITDSVATTPVSMSFAHFCLHYAVKGAGFRVISLQLPGSGDLAAYVKWQANQETDAT